MTLLHHKYAMDMYSLNAGELFVEMADWYDHSLFATQMTEVRLSDLTNHPYTRSPVRFFEIASKDGQQP